MKKSKQPGVIVNLSSVFALEPQPLLPIFSASKAGVLAATIAFSVSILSKKYVLIKHYGT